MIFSSLAAQEFVFLDDFRCNHWWKFHQRKNDGIFVSVNYEDGILHSPFLIISRSVWKICRSEKFGGFAAQYQWCEALLSFLCPHIHYSDVIVGAMASPITSLNRIFRRRSKKTSPVTGEFPAQRASNAENVSIWWHHHILFLFCRAR